MFKYRSWKNDRKTQIEILKNRKKFSLEKECCDVVNIADPHLEDRGGGFYRKKSNFNGKPFYEQEGGSNYIYFNGDYYAVGERTESLNFLYQE